MSEKDLRDIIAQVLTEMNVSDGATASAVEAAKKERRVVMFFLLELFLNFKEIVVPAPTRVT